MIPTNIILMLGLASALAFGIADFFGAKASKRMGPITSALCMQAAATVLYTLYYLVFIHEVPAMSAEVLAYTGASSVLIALGSCVLYRAFEIGPVSIASPLSAAYPLVAALAGVLFFHARLDSWQIVGIVLLVGGMMAVSGLFGIKMSEWRLSKGPRLALLATLAWGLGYPLLGEAIDAAGWQAVTFVEMLLMLVVIAVVLIAVHKHEPVAVRSPRTLLFSPVTIGAGVGMVAAELAINIGFEYGQSAGALVVAISSAYPVLTILLALHHFKERISLWPTTGVGATICGVVVLLLA